VDARAGEAAELARKEVAHPRADGEEARPAEEVAARPERGDLEALRRGDRPLDLDPRGAARLDDEARRHDRRARLEPGRLDADAFDDRQRVEPALRLLDRRGAKRLAGRIRQPLAYDVLIDRRLGLDRRLAEDDGGSGVDLQDDRRR